MPAGWASLTASCQAADASSTLSLYRRALVLRRRFAGSLAWRPSPPDVLDFARQGWGRCVVNLSDRDFPLDAAPVLVSGPLNDDGSLPPDTAAWLR